MGLVYPKIYFVYYYSDCAEILHTCFCIFFLFLNYEEKIVEKLALLKERTLLYILTYCQKNFTSVFETILSN